VKGSAYLKQLFCCRNNEAVRKQLKTNFPYFGVKVMKGAETDCPLSVRDSAKAIPRSLPIIYITHVTPNAMAAQNVAEECSFAQIVCTYTVADKSLARPGRKQATATENFYVHISYL
jgi:hypothetical protein